MSWRAGLAPAVPALPWERGPVGLVLEMRPLKSLPASEMQPWRRPVPTIPQRALAPAGQETSLVPMGRPRARASRARAQWDVKKDRRGRLEARWFQLLRRHPEAGPRRRRRRKGTLGP